MAEATDIVERVARAIAIADAKPGQHPLLLTSENYMSATRKLARAALAAMLEAVGEPVAWLYSLNIENGVQHVYRGRQEPAHGWTETPLYSLAAFREAPPQD